MASNSNSSLDSLPKLGIPSLQAAWEYWFQPMKFMDRCSRLGDRFRLDLPGLPPIVCLSSPADNRRIFTGDQTALHFGEAVPKMAPHEVVLGPSTIVLKDDEEHLKDRRLLAPHFSPRAVQTYAPLFRNKTRQQIEQWRLDKPIAFHEEMMKLTLDIIIDAVFGILDEENAGRIKQATLDLLDVVGGPAFMLSTIIAVSRGGKWDGKYRRLRHALNRMDNCLAKEISQRRGGENPGRQDMLALYLQLQAENPDQITDQVIYESLRTLLVAGYETTASSIAWMGERISRNAEVIARLEQAVAEGDDAYLEAVISEALRTRPNVPHTLRQVVKPFDMGDGLVLPPGVMVLVMTSLCHQRADVFPQPEKFDPQRFLGKPASAYELITFGGGVRRCLGASFALLEMREILRTLVKHLHFEHTTAADEKVVRRNITLIPAGGAMISFSRRRENRTAA